MLIVFIFNVNIMLILMGLTFKYLKVVLRLLFLSVLHNMGFLIFHNTKHVIFKVLNWL